MTMRKGFLHIVEAILVVAIVFFTLPQFSTIPRIVSSWDNARLTLMAEDILFSMDSNQTNWFDADEVTGKLESLLSPTVTYRVSTTLDVRPFVNVTCVCGPLEYPVFTGIMGSSVTLNGIERKIENRRVNPGGLDFSLNRNLDTDVIVFFDEHPSLTAEQEENLSTFMSNGGGVVQFRELEDTDVGDSWHDMLFGMDWVYEGDSARTVTAQSDFSFLYSTDEAYKAKKIFGALYPGFTGFSNFALENVTVEDPEKVLVQQYQGGSPSVYSGGPYDGRPVPMSVINYNVRGSGRAAWMSNASLDIITGPENRMLLRSLVLWAGSAKPFDIVGGSMKKSARATITKVVNANFFEPVRIDMSLGYIY